MISLEYNNIVTPAVVPSIHISHGNTPHRIMYSHLSPSLLTVVVRQPHHEQRCILWLHVMS